jgi:hypothetical protein
MSVQHTGGGWLRYVWIALLAALLCACPHDKGQQKHLVGTDYPANLAGDVNGAPGANEATGLLSHALPSLSTGCLQWSGSAWTIASCGGASGVTSAYVYQPGGSAGANVYTSFSSLYTVISAVAGPIIVLVDDSFTSPAVIPSGSYSLSNVTFWGVANASNEFASLQFASGATVSASAIYFHNIEVSMAGSAPIFTDGSYLYLEGWLSSFSPTASSPMFSVTAGGNFVVQMYGGNFGDGTNPVVTIATGATMYWNGNGSDVEPYAVTGSGAAAGANYAYDAATIVHSSGAGADLGTYSAQDALFRLFGLPTGTGLWYESSGSPNGAAIALDGDVTQGALSGSNVPLTVTALQGNAVSSTAPTTHYSLIWGGSSWAPSLVSLSSGVTGNLAVGNVAPGTSPQVLMTTTGPTTAWETISQDMSLGATGAATVSGLQANSLPSLSSCHSSGGYLEWTGSAWTCGSGGSSVTWANDLSGSTNSDQYVASISGNAGGGGAVPLSANAYLSAASSSHSYIDLTGANSSYGYAKFLNYVYAPSFDAAATSGAVGLGNVNAGTVTIGNTANTLTTELIGHPLEFFVQGTQVGKLNASSSDYLYLDTSQHTQLAPGSLLTTSGNMSVDAAATLNLGASTATGWQLGNASTTLVGEIIGNPVEIFAGASQLAYLKLSASDYLYLGASGSEAQHLPTGITFQNGVASPTFQQSALTANANPNSITISTQAPANLSGATVANNTPGSLLVSFPNPGSTTSQGLHAALKIQDNSQNVAWIGNYAAVTSGNSGYSGIWLGGGTSGITPTNANYALLSDGTNLTVNAPGSGTIYVNANGSGLAEFTSAAFSPQANNGLSLGTGALGWSTINSEYFVTAASSVFGGSGAAWEFPSSFAYGAIAFSGAASSGAGAPLYITAQNAASSGGHPGGPLYLLSGGPNGGGGTPGFVGVGIGGATSTLFTPTGTAGGFEVADSNAVQFMVGNGGVISGGNTAFTQLWLGNGTTSWTPSTTNYMLSYASSVGLTMNVPASGGTIYLSTNGNAQVSVSSSLIGFVAPVGGYAANNALAWSNASVSCTAGGTITLTASQYADPVIILTGTLPSNTTVVFPSTVGAIWHVLDQTSRSSHTLSAQVGSGSAEALPTASSSAWPGQWVDVGCLVANTTLIK